MQANRRCTAGEVFVVAAYPGTSLPSCVAWPRFLGHQPRLPLQYNDHRPKSSAGIEAHTPKSRPCLAPYAPVRLAESRPPIAGRTRIAVALFACRGSPWHQHPKKRPFSSHRRLGRNCRDDDFFQFRLPTPSRRHQNRHFEITDRCLQKQLPEFSGGEIQTDMLPPDNETVRPFPSPFFSFGPRNEDNELAVALLERLVGNEHYGLGFPSRIQLHTYGSVCSVLWHRYSLRCDNGACAAASAHAHWANLPHAVCPTN